MLIESTSDRSSNTLLEIDFSQSGDSDVYRRDGWSWQESDRVWGIDTESDLLIPALPNDTPLEVRLCVGCFVHYPFRSVQRFIVFFNDVEIGRSLLTDPTNFHWITTYVPAPLINNLDENRIRFSHPDAIIPADIVAWDDATSHDPRHPTMADPRNLSVALHRLTISREENAKANETLADEPTLSGMPKAVDLVQRFQSIGDNCEFGLFQRGVGAEPLGLMRFAGVQLEDLIRALNERFKGLGSRELTEVIIHEKNQEYLVRENNWGIFYHTHRYSWQIDSDVLLSQEINRLKYLARNLLLELEEAQKIFVFQSKAEHRIDDILRLKRALADYGPGTLLWVRRADDPSQVGSVEVADDGLLIGYVDRYSPPGNPQDVSIEAWLRVCESAWLTWITGQGLVSN